MCGIVGILGREPVAPHWSMRSSGWNIAVTTPPAWRRWRAGT